jgi:hypothetical protein
MAIPLMPVMYNSAAGVGFGRAASAGHPFRSWVAQTEAAFPQCRVQRRAASKGFFLVDGSHLPSADGPESTGCAFADADVIWDVEVHAEVAYEPSHLLALQ